MIAGGLSAPTNSLGGIAAATASPALAYEIGQYFKENNTEGSAAHLLAHAALGAAVAAAGGNNALVGAASAAGGEAAAPALAQWLYGKDADDLTTDEKQTISSIIGLAGAAAGASTGNAADVASGSQLGQNAVENNTFAGDRIREQIEEIRKYWHTDKEAQSFTEALHNGVVNIIAGSADGVVATPDYLIDNINVLVYCTGISPNLCQQAQNTLNPKNQEILNFAKSVMNLETYANLLTVMQMAQQGDYQAQEMMITVIGSLVQRKQPNTAALANLAKNGKNHAISRFPSNPNDLTTVLGVEPKITLTQHGTTRMVWEPNSNTRIRYESHPDDVGVYNPRHHGEHYHIEIKPDNLTWNQAKKQNAIQKIKPENYKPGHGTGFLPNEKYPGK